MLYRRQGIPEEEEIVLCKVTKIFPNSIFVDILEYPPKSGMVHISEVSPGRIRNLRDYVEIDRQIVCKVLRIDQEKGHIDLSLRRVNSTQREAKLEEIKQELKAEGLVKNLSKKIGRTLPELYKEITEKVFIKYSHLYLCFKEVVDDPLILENLGLEKKLAQELAAAVIDKFKPPKIFLKGEIKLLTYASNGVERIKSLLKEVAQLSPTIKLVYLGGGRYKLVIEDFDYKPAENTFRRVQELLHRFADEISTASLERQND